MRRFFRMFCSLFLMISLLFCSACSSGSDEGELNNNGSTTTGSATGTWDNSIKVLTPVAAGTNILGNVTIVIDASNATDGYLMAMYTGSAARIKFFITTPDQIKYTYDLTTSSTYSTLPLTGGNGTYAIDVMEHVVDNKYSALYSTSISVDLANEFSPYLYPNQFTKFDAQTKAVSKASELTASATDTLSAIEQIYNYVTTNVTYDYDKAKTVASTYLPNVDETLSTGKGICFDYAALMTAMLRSQGIPTKLEIGYSGEVYHSWISTYTEETGWIGNVIHFDGKAWSLMDPTLAANNSSKNVKSYIGDGTNYTLKYSR